MRIVVALALCLSPVFAQSEHGGVPVFPSQGGVVVPTVRTLDGVLDVRLDNAGRWDDVAHGGRVWRVRIESPGAESLLLVFDRFSLPVGASLFLYDDEREIIRGAFTHLNNGLDGTLAIGSTPGDTLTLEYFEPSVVDAPGELALVGLVRDAGDVFTKQGWVPSKKAGKCHVDVSCAEGEGWGDQVRAVVFIQAKGKNCTGVLLNNTAGDGTPYVLTAGHCGDLSRSTFRFNWRSPECANGEIERKYDFITGSTLLKSNAKLDMQLVRLASNPPKEFDVTFVGWDRRGIVPESVTCLHHPAGDVMKLSRDADAPIKERNNWKIRRWEIGATQNGSSGAPLFDPSRRFIGQLWGGNATCKKPVDDLFRRLEREWPALEPYLDPLGTGTATLDLLDPRVTPLVFSVRSVEPARIALGTTRIRVSGSGFGASTRVEVDGEPLEAESVRWITNGRLEVDLPELALGHLTLVVLQGEESARLEIEVIDPE